MLLTLKKLNKKTQLRIKTILNERLKLFFCVWPEIMMVPCEYGLMIAPNSVTKTTP